MRSVQCFLIFLHPILFLLLDFVEAILLELIYEKGIRLVLVEGGRVTAEAFLQRGFVDEMYMFIGDLFLEDGGILSPTTDREIRNVILDVRIMKGGLLLKIDPSKFKREWK